MGASEGLPLPERRTAASRLRDVVVVGAAAVLAAVFLRVLVLGAVRIPSPSMEPTLLPGDVLLVNKLAYDRTFPLLPAFIDPSPPVLSIPGAAEPRVGDVVVFRLPENDRWGEASGRTLVKRCVGGPGDSVIFAGDHVWVNGLLVEAPGGVKTSPLAKPERRVRIPRPGESIALGRETDPLLMGIVEAEGHNVSSNGAGALVDGIPARTYVVRRRYFAMLGDNRAESIDSRVWGLVPEDALVGRALAVFWSWNDGLRSDRLGMVVR
jgi:signal peptidase I